jgi:MFS family permease
MKSGLSLLNKRRFLPLFITQFLNAFNDNFYKMAMVMVITYSILQGGETEEATFNAYAGAAFIMPFFLLSAVAGQMADGTDKARMIRIIKTAEIGIMIAGAAGIYFHNIPLMFVALFSMGIHSTFFGPIKYGILPQHLGEDEVLGGTGLVEAGTYLAILLGTIVGGILPYSVSAIAVIITAVIGRIAAQYVPYAPPEVDGPSSKVDWNIIRSSWRLVSATLHIRRLFLAIMAISFFWGVGAILTAQFPPMVKSGLGGDPSVATMFTAVFSVGIAIGSVVINMMLKGKVSAKYAPISVILMGLCVLALWWNVKDWPHAGAELMDYKAFLSIAQGDYILLSLLGISVFGGMFVVPLYAFLTTTVHKSETSRTIAANNIVNSGAMVIGVIIYGLLVQMNISIADTLFMVAAACLVAAWIAQILHKACD